LEILQSDPVAAVRADDLGDLLRLTNRGAPHRPVRFQFSDLASEIPKKDLPKFVDGAKAAGDRGLVGGRLELPKPAVLCKVNPIRIDWPVGEVQHRRLPAGDKLIDLLDGT
jgi:hypothetical protein